MQQLKSKNETEKVKYIESKWVYLLFLKINCNIIFIKMRT